MQFKNIDYQVAFTVKSISLLNLLGTIIDPFPLLRDFRNLIVCLSLLVPVLFSQLRLKSVLVDAILRSQELTAPFRPYRIQRSLQ